MHKQPAKLLTFKKNKKKTHKKAYTILAINVI
jgi:hypothetical protein